MYFSLARVVESLELAMAVAGAVLFWRLVLSRAARARPVASALPRWDAPPSEFFVFLLYVMGGFFICGVAASVIAKQLSLKGDEVTVFNGAGAQLGMLAGVVVYWLRPDRRPPKAPPDAPSVLLSGAATFLASLPVLIVTAKISELILGNFFQK
jgi:hypothetical protein